MNTQKIESTNKQVTLGLVVDIEKLLSGDLQNSFSLNTAGNQAEVKADVSKTTTLESLGFSNRTMNALKNNGIDTHQKLSEMSIGELRQMKGIGPNAVTEIKNASVTKDVVMKEAKKSIKEAVLSYASGLSKRTVNVLVRNEIKSLDMLKGMERRDIVKMKGAGRTVLMELEVFLEKKLVNVTGKAGRPANKEKMAETGMSLIDDNNSIVGKGLTKRAFNILNDKGIVSISDLIELDIEAFAKEKGVGSKVLQEVKDLIEASKPKPAGRGRGRPRKVEEVQVTETVVATTGRGRGRPRKVEETQVTEAVITTGRGRGRPQKSIDELELSSRVVKTLHKNGIDFLKQLRNMTENDLSSIKGLSAKSVTEIKEKVGLKGNKREKLEDLELSAKAVKALNDNGVKFVDQLRKLDDEGIMSMNGVGAVIFKEIKKVLHA